MLSIALLSSSCQKQVLEDEDDGRESPAHVFPRGTGEGTFEFPFTVKDVQEGTAAGASGQVWVIGYVVGSAYRSLDNASFSLENASSSSLLLSSDSLCTDVTHCIPVELSSTKWQSQFALPSNPSGYHQCVMFMGTPALYYRKNGLRSLSEGHWLYGFDISSISREPQEWEYTIISW
ncbi:MAG: DUF6359 domain-containing protein [Bacteroidaceae bacterium]